MNYTIEHIPVYISLYAMVIYVYIRENYCPTLRILLKLYVTKLNLCRIALFEKK